MNGGSLLEEALVNLPTFPEKSITLAKQCLSNGIENNIPMYFINIHTILASAYSAQERHVEALKHINKAKYIYKEHRLHNLSSLNHIKLTEATILGVLGNTQIAIKMLYDVLESIQTLDNVNVRSLTNCYNNISTIYTIKGNYYKALNMLRKAKELQTKNKVGNIYLGATSINFAFIFIKLKNYDLAFDYLKEALRYLENEDNIWLKDIAYAHYYNIILIKNSYNEFELEQNLKITLNNLEQKHIFGVAVFTISTLGKLYLKLNRLKDAEKYGKKGLQICKKYQLGDRIFIEIYKFLFRKNVQIEKYEGAFKYGELIRKIYTKSKCVDYEILEIMEQLINLYKQKGYHKLGLDLALEYSKEKFDFEHNNNTFQLESLKANVVIEQKEREIDYINSINDINKRNNEQLARLNKELESFAGIASHDLQAPLQSIIGFANLLEKKYGSILSKDVKYLRLIVQSGNNMNNLLVNLLSYAKVGNYNEETEAISLNNIIRQVKLNLTALINERRAKIKVENLPIINGHFTPVCQLFQNLIANAIKYSRDNTTPSIYIYSEEKANDIHIYIKDNGIGIANEKLSTIFEPFKRGGNNLPSEGTGLGLATCKKIMISYKGNIKVESIINKGSKFILIFPKIKNNLQV